RKTHSFGYATLILLVAAVIMFLCRTALADVFAIRFVSTLASAVNFPYPILPEYEGARSAANRRPSCRRPISHALAVRAIDIEPVRIRCGQACKRGAAIQIWRSRGVPESVGNDAACLQAGDHHPIRVGYRSAGRARFQVDVCGLVYTT